LSSQPDVWFARSGSSTTTFLGGFGRSSERDRDERGEGDGRHVVHKLFRRHTVLPVEADALLSLAAGPPRRELTLMPRFGSPSSARHGRTLKGHWTSRTARANPSCPTRMSAVTTATSDGGGHTPRPGRAETGRW